MDHILFSHSSADGHWCCFYLLVVVTKAAINIHVQKEEKCCQLVLSLICPLPQYFIYLSTKKQTIKHNFMLSTDKLQMSARGPFLQGFCSRMLSYESLVMRREVAFQMWKPCSQGRRGQVCLGQGCAGSGELRSLRGSVLDIVSCFYVRPSLRMKSKYRGYDSHIPYPTVQYARDRDTLPTLG